MTEHESNPSLTDQILNHFLSNLVENHGFHHLTPNDLSQIKSLSDLTDQAVLNMLIAKGVETDNESN